MALVLQLLVATLLCVHPASGGPPPPTPATSYQLISCADTLQSFTESWSSTSAPTPSDNSSWVVKGASASSSTEVKLRFVKRVGPGNVNLFIEYLNDSPRRVVVEGVGAAGKIHLLEGGSASGWAAELVVADAGGSGAAGLREVTLTALLKSPQKLYIRKLILFRPTGPATTPSAFFADKSCADLTPRPATPTGPPSRNTLPASTTTATSCKRNKGTSTSDEQDGCAVCPECKCVCNCNCGGAAGAGGCA